MVEFPFLFLNHLFSEKMAYLKCICLRRKGFWVMGGATKAGWLAIPPRDASNRNVTENN